MEIKSKFRNNLLKRKEIVVSFESDTNPGFLGAKSIIISKMDVSEDVVVVRYVKNNFGAHDYVVEAFIYDSKDDLDRIEPKKKAKRGNK